MVKRTRDEPDDKALQRLQQFEDQRKAVPGENKENDNKQKNKKNGTEKRKENKIPDKATDKLKG